MKSFNQAFSPYVRAYIRAESFMIDMFYEFKKEQNFKQINIF